MFEIEVTNNRASTKRGELLTKGQIGAQVQFTFNDHWTGMKKTAVFKRCGKTIDVVDSEWNGDIVTIPLEMTEEAGLLVHVGVYGVSEDGKRITPTLYAPLGAVALGAEPDGDPSTDPTLPVWSQIQAQIGDMSALETEAKDNLVAAINEAAKLAPEALIVGITENNGTLSADKTFQEIEGAILAGTTVLVDYDDTLLPLMAKASDFLFFGVTNCANDGATSAAFSKAIGISESDGVQDISAEISGAQEPLIGSINDIAPSQVYEAVQAGRPVILNSGVVVYTAFSASIFVVFSSVIFDNVIRWLSSDPDTDTWEEGITEIPTKIPTALPNPNALTFTGAVTGSYDGSNPVNVEIPSAVTDDHINSLIDTKLGVIENGSY